MVKDPWKDPDPRPGDFDESLQGIDAQLVESGNRNGRLTRVVAISAEDAALLDQLAAKRGKRPGEVVAELVRNA